MTADLNILAFISAVDDIANGSKKFKENLKLLGDQEGTLKKAIAALKAQQKEYDEKLETLTVKDKHVTDLEVRVNIKQKKADIAAAKVKAEKTEVGVLQTEATSLLTQAKATQAELQKNITAFEKSSITTARNLDKREFKVKAKEDKVNRVLEAMDKAE